MSIKRGPRAARPQKVLGGRPTNRPAGKGAKPEVGPLVKVGVDTRMKAKATNKYD